MAEEVKTPKEVAELAKQGIIAAIPKKGETPEAAVERVQKKHPGKRVVDPVNPNKNLGSDDATSAALAMAARSIKFREALGRTKGFTNICRMGHKLLPKPICNRPIPELPAELYTNEKPMGEVPEAWMQPYSVCAARWRKGVLRRGFSIVEVRKNKVENVEQIGRVWSPYFEGAFHVDRGAAWGSKFIKLEPVFSGLGSETLEKTALNALSALPYAFAGARASDFSDDARHGVHGLTRRPYNAVRLLTRFAVMWLGALFCEEESRRLVLAGYDSAPAVRYIRSCGDMSIGLTDAIDARAQTLYIEMSRIGRDPTILEVFFAAMVRKPQWRTVMSDKEVPAILNLWPDIPHPQLAIYGRDEAVLHVESLSAATIWMAIEVFVQQMALRDQWNEVLHSVATLALRPDQDTVFCGHKAIRLALPESSLGPAALGPIMENARHWEDEAMPVVQPTVPELMWGASARYAIWSLTFRDLCAACGGNEGNVFACDVGQAKRIEWTLHAGTTVVASNRICEKTAEEYGWETALGRILRTVCGMTKTALAKAPKMYANTAIAHKHSLQWEEVLPYTDRIPEGSAALSLVYPARALSVPGSGEWTAPMNVVNRHGLSDAMYTMNKYHGCRSGYTIYWRGLQKYKVIGTHVSVNYRGGMADSQFFATYDESGTVVEPVFKFTEPIQAMTAYQQSQYDYESEWYVEHEIDQSFDGMLHHFHELDQFMEPVRPAGFRVYGKRMEDLPEEEEIEADVVPPEQETVRGRSPSPDQMSYEDKKAGKEPRARAVADSMKFFNVQRAIITRVMEEEPEWVQFIAEIKHLKGNPLEQKDEIARLAQLVVQRLRAMDPTMLPHAATDQTRVPQMMRGCAYMLKEFAAYVTGHDSIQLMLRMAEGCRCVARSFELGEGIFDSISWSIIHNRQLPGHITPEEFDRGIRLGLTVGDIIFSRDYQHLARLLTEAEDAMRVKLEKEDVEGVVGAYEPKDADIELLKGEFKWTDVKVPPPSSAVGGESSSMDTGGAGASGSGLMPSEDPKPGLEEPDPIKEPVLETRTETVAIESAPEALGGDPFGGEQPSQDDGGKDQPPDAAGASSAAGGSPKVAHISFEARSPPEK